MNTRRRFVLGSLVGALLIHVAIVACSSAGGTSSPRDGGSFGEVLDAFAAGDVTAAVDALREAATNVHDAEVRDANAGGRVYEIACDQEGRTRSLYAPDGGVLATVETTAWWGIVPNLQVSPSNAPRITVYTCDAENFGVTGVTCPDGWRCDQTGFTFRRHTCTQGGSVIDSDGRVLASCGYRSVTVNTSTTSESGTRYRRAFVRVE